MASELPDLRIDPVVIRLVKDALVEDLGPTERDATTESVVSAQATAVARMVVREDCVVSGTRVAELVFEHTDERVASAILVPDGKVVTAGTAVMEIGGPARGVLTGERVALNFVQRMTGIATLTREFVDAVSDYGVDILDTRKTAPGMRVLEKYAVLCGGGRNHRMNLGEMVMIKDNHRAFWDGEGELGLEEAVRTARATCPDIPIEIEVDTFEELKEALAGEPDWVLLDNMSSDLMKECVSYCAGRAKLEASGGITLDTVEPAAASGVDAISLGCLTHSARAVDISLELKRV